MATKPRTQPYEINHELVLSTAHMTQHDAHKMDKESVEDPIPYWWLEKFDFGYRILVNEETPRDMLMAGMSAAIVALMPVAAKLKCKWLVLDSDGPVRNDLPQFEW